MVDYNIKFREYLIISLHKTICQLTHSSFLQFSYNIYNLYYNYLTSDITADAKIYWYIDGVKQGEGETFDVSF